ncbi:MAG: hypothetical protein FJ096_21560 [Deltaproteobacteria bacterium]|nr:hypothetical protein [Deltaproteobacteria bacterium]
MRKLFLLAALLVGAGCTSARVTAKIDGEPVCADFELGATRTKLKGALKRPVKVTVLDGKTVLSERVVLGKRAASDPASVLVVQDESETYTIRFAQCANEFAPQPLGASVDKDTKRRDDHTMYDCGDATVYKELQVEVKSGKPETRVVAWQAPPDAACLGADAAAPLPSAPVPSAPVPSAPVPSAPVPSAPPTAAPVGSGAAAP